MYIKPHYILETSWEVCNKVGGIYTVLSTKAKTLVEQKNSTLIFFGPDFKDNTPLFKEDKTLYAGWRAQAAAEGVKVRAGRWNIPGNPITLLIDYKPCYAQRNEFYARLWEEYEVDSLHGTGDYDESLMFSLGVGRAVESFYKHVVKKGEKVVFQSHEWMTGASLLYVRSRVPAIATIFTTHATTVGRSIASNGKLLYDYFEGYHGDQMAAELGVQSKHSVEKAAAQHAHCFTTVSELTAQECVQFLGVKPHVLLLNGFEGDFVSKGAAFTAARRRARAVRLGVAGALMGTRFDDDTLIVGIGGRYEMRNKGLDLFLDAIARLSRDERLSRPIVVYVDVPAWVDEPRWDLKERLQSPRVTFDEPLPQPYLTHWLHNMGTDQMIETLRYHNLINAPESRVKVIFAPCYLTGHDGIFNLSYYDSLIGNDLNIYPSYYEPWGYTPMESAAFKIPTVTTNFAGFGLWVNSLLGHAGTLDDGIAVLHRTDDNYSAAAEVIKETILTFASKSKEEVKSMRTRAAAIAEKALWKHFIQYYYQAYGIAIEKAAPLS